MSERSITILSEYFYPEEASTAQLLTELAIDLTDAFDVSVITGHPNYHDDDRNQSISKRSTHKNVKITRVRATRFDKDSIPRRVINWISFTFLAGIRLIRKDPGDVILVLSNPPILPMATWLAKRLRGTPYVYLIFDMYPDMPIQLGILPEDAVTTRLWQRMMRVFYRDADRIIVLGESMERRMKQKMADDPDFNPEKIEVIPNWEDGEFIQPVAKEANDFAREQDTIEKFTLIYSGNIGRYHELETAIDAIGRLEADGRTDIQLLIIGEGARKSELQSRVKEKGIDHVRFLPFQPLERLPETLTCGDAALVGITPEMEGMCVSSKLYSSLAAGVPILAVVAEGDEVARVVRDASCGEHIDQGAVECAADILTTWADNPKLVDELGENARKCFEKNYTRNHAVDAYTNLLRSIISERDKR